MKNIKVIDKRRNKIIAEGTSNDFSKFYADVKNSVEEYKEKYHLCGKDLKIVERQF